MVYVPDRPMKQNQKFKKSTPKMIKGQMVVGAPKNPNRYSGIGSRYGAPGTPSNPKPKVRDRDTPRPKPGKGGNFSIQPVPKGGGEMHIPENDNKYTIQPIPKPGGDFNIQRGHLSPKDPEHQNRRKKALTKRFKSMSSKYGKREGFEEPEEN